MTPESLPIVVGAPTKRAVARALGEFAVLLGLVPLALLARGPMFAAVAAIAIPVIAAMILAGYDRVSIGQESILRQSWWESLTRDSPEEFRIPSSRTLVRFPDGCWDLGHGFPVALSAPWWQGGQLEEAFERSGLTIDDRQALWRRDHRWRDLARRLIWLPWIAIWIVPQTTLVAILLGGVLVGAAAAPRHAGSTLEGKEGERA